MRNAARQCRVALQQLGLAGDEQQRCVGALPFGLQQAEDAPGGLFVFDELHVSRGDAQVALGQHHVQVGKQRAEERPLLVHALQQRGALGAVALVGVIRQEGLDGAAEAAPARQPHAALAPAEAPRNGAQVFDGAGGFAVSLAHGGAAADVELGNLADGRGGEEVVCEARRAVDQPAIGLEAGFADGRCCI